MVEPSPGGSLKTALDAARRGAVFLRQQSGGAHGAGTSAEPTPTKSPELPGDGGLATGIARIRATSRWVVVSFGAIAAIMVGTAPLDKLGESGSAPLLALAGLALALMGTVVVIAFAAAIDQPVGVSAAELAAAERLEADEATCWRRSFGNKWAIRNAARWICETDLIDIKERTRPEESTGGEANPGVPTEEPTPTALVAAEREDEYETCLAAHPIALVIAERTAASKTWLADQWLIEAAPNATAREKLEAKFAGHKARFERFDAELGRLIDLANYQRIRKRFGWRKWFIIGGAVVAAVGISIFNYAVNEKATPRDLAGISLVRAANADFQGVNPAGANLESADLTGTDLRSADLTGAQLRGANLKGAKLDGTDLTAANLTGAQNLNVVQVKDVAKWISATCPDGKPLQGVSSTCATAEQLGAAKP